tara:strand:- start:179 stop:460 length:282 start_codon:yes stop_codon:yes gene_type:complete
MKLEDFLANTDIQNTLYLSDQAREQVNYNPETGTITLPVNSKWHKERIQQSLRNLRPQIDLSIEYDLKPELYNNFNEISTTDNSNNAGPNTNN